VNMKSRCKGCARKWKHTHSKLIEVISHFHFPHIFPCLPWAHERTLMDGCVYLSCQWVGHWSNDIRWCGVCHRVSHCGGLHSTQWYSCCSCSRTGTLLCHPHRSLFLLCLNFPLYYQVRKIWQEHDDDNNEEDYIYLYTHMCSLMSD